jgi:hypothetical protein
MVPVSSSLLAGIRLTQCGDPLAHRDEDCLHCVSAHRVAGLGVGATAPAHGVDKEVAQSRFLQWDITEAWRSSVFGAKLDPALEMVAAAASSFGDESCV